MKKLLPSFLAIICLISFIPTKASAQCVDSVGVMAWTIQGPAGPITGKDLVQSGFAANADAPSTSYPEVRIGKLWNYRHAQWTSPAQYPNSVQCNVNLIINHTHIADLRYFDVVQFRVVLVTPFSGTKTSGVSTYLYLPCREANSARLVAVNNEQDPQLDASIALTEFVSHIDAIHIIGGDKSTSVDINSLRIVTGEAADAIPMENPLENLQIANNGSRNLRIDNPTNVPYHLHVMNITGQVITSSEVTGTFNFESPDIAPGIYLFEATLSGEAGNDARKVFKVIIQ